MLSTVLLTLLSASTPPSPLSVHAPFAVRAPMVQEEDAAARIAALGEDVDKLLALAEELTEAGDRSGSRAAFERVLEIDPENEAAHKGLRHHQYDGQWFTSYAALSKYRREEAKRMLEEKGLVRFNDDWVPQEDVPYLRMGWVEHDGEWTSQHKLDVAKEAAALREKGWQQRAEDSTWISPEDFKLWEDGLYKIDDEWFTKEEANEYHSQIGQWWEYIGDHFVCRSTLDVDTTNWARWYADETYDDLVRIFGVEPKEKPIFGVFNSLAQYNSFAAGDQAAQRGPSESTGFSSLHYAYLADVWFDVVGPQSIEYVGGGIAYWDAGDEKMANWGPFAVRHAAGLSYVESIDRSWETVSQFVSAGGGGGGGGPASIWDEKRIPSWLGYGAASYVERYYQDEEAEDPWGVRDWAIAQVTAKGEPDPLEDIFRLPLDINDIDGSERYIHEAGLVVSFVMDGGCEPVVEAHQRFKEAMASGDHAEAEAAVESLEQTVIENEDAFRAYAGLGPKPTAEAEPVDATATTDQG